MKIVSHFRKIKRQLSKQRPLITITISRKRLLSNLHSFKNKYPDLKIAPVLKSNAYGHGLFLVAEILDKENLPFFILDSFFEAQALKKSGIKTNLLVIGFTNTETVLETKADCAFTITDLSQLKELSLRATRPIRLHVKIDTGMHRQGIMPDEIQEAKNLIGKNENLELEGICTHLADADSVDPAYTQKQIGAWEYVVRDFKETFPEIQHVHFSATAGARYTENVPGNILRLGLGLYGIDPSPSEKNEVFPVLQMETTVSSLRDLKEGECIGYNCTHIFGKPSRVATIPVGYFEGVDRRLSGCGSMKTKDVECPIVGRVSMNITSVDVSKIPDINTGDSVIVISKEAGDKNSVEQIAKTTGAIPWEILVHIPQHLYRKIVD